MDSKNWSLWSCVDFSRFLSTLNSGWPSLLLLPPLPEDIFPFSEWPWSIPKILRWSPATWSSCLVRAVLFRWRHACLPSARRYGPSHRRLLDVRIHGPPSRLTLCHVGLTFPADHLRCHWLRGFDCFARRPMTLGLSGWPKSMLLLIFIGGSSYLLDLRWRDQSWAY